MRKDYKTKGKTRAELARMVSELLRRVYRLEREKALLRRSLQVVQVIVSRDPLSACQDKVKNLVKEVISKTDSRRNRKKASS